MATENHELKLTASEMAAFIDHTLLKPEANQKALEILCREAAEHGFKTVCVNSGFVRQAGQNLKGTKVGICSVVGFPLGAMESAAKAFEAEKAVQDGATEIDMVLNLGLFKSGLFEQAEQDIAAVRRAVGPDCTLKVIIETCLLNKEEIGRACDVSRAAGANFVKTSTGFSTGGAKVEDVALMRAAVGPQMGVKASGGVKDLPTALAMIRAGADRIGTSSGVAILAGFQD